MDKAKYKIDFVAIAGTNVLVDQEGVTRINVDGVNIHFGDEDPVKLKTALNKAMGRMLPTYLQRNLHAAGTYLSEQQLHEMVLKVVTHFLYMYSNWRRTNEKYRNLKLELSKSDFDSGQAHLQCYWYCQAHLQKDFRTAAAAFMDKTEEQLTAFEEAQERYENK